MCYSRFNHAYATQPFSDVASQISFAGTLGEPSSPTWCMDSRASEHMINTPSYMTDICPYTGIKSFLIGNGSLLSISHIGWCSVFT